jgi:hypothetical protein
LSILFIILCVTVISAIVESHRAPAIGRRARHRARRAAQAWSRRSVAGTRCKQDDRREQNGKFEIFHFYNL